MTQPGFVSLCFFPDAGIIKAQGDLRLDVAASTIGRLANIHNEIGLEFKIGVGRCVTATSGGMQGSAEGKSQDKEQGSDHVGVTVVCDECVVYHAL